jgi:hypothetical protein
MQSVQKNYEIECFYGIPNQILIPSIAICGEVLNVLALIYSVVFLFCDSNALSQHHYIKLTFVMCCNGISVLKVLFGYSSLGF